ncbi:hypothetical protein IJC60_00030 [bacterium]|nr:hypothetical protein [bacterium]
MIALEALKFTFKNFKKLLPYFILPYLLVTLGTVLGFIPAYSLVKNDYSSIFIIIGLVGLVLFLASFWSYIVKGAGLYSLINGLLATGQLLPYSGADRNIEERAGKFIKFLLYYALISILIVLSAIAPYLIYAITTNILLTTISSIGIIVFVAWAFIRLAFVYPAFVFNNFEDAKEPIKYSYELSRGKAVDIFTQGFVLGILLQIILTAGSVILTLIMVVLQLSEGVKFALESIYNLSFGLLYFATMPALTTMLYRKYNGSFEHSDWVALMETQNS